MTNDELHPELIALREICLSIRTGLLSRRATDSLTTERIRVLSRLLSLLAIDTGDLSGFDLAMSSLPHNLGLGHAAKVYIGRRESASVGILREEKRRRLAGEHSIVTSLSVLAAWLVTKDPTRDRQEINEGLDLVGYSLEMLDMAQSDYHTRYSSYLRGDRHSYAPIALEAFERTEISKS